jgi:hypothetical protein
LEQFGWWFASGAFEPWWALEHLQQVLLLTGGIDLDHAVAQRLEVLAEEYPEAVLHCLSPVDFSGGGRPFRAHSWMEHARAIVEVGLNSADGGTRAEAVALVNRIVAAGHLEFRTFLDEQPPIH